MSNETNESARAESERFVDWLDEGGHLEAEGIGRNLLAAYRRSAEHADRLAAVEAERDDLMALAVEDTHRRGIAEAERDTARREKAEVEARLRAVEALGVSWVGFDHSHPYGDAVLTALAAEVTP